MFKNLVPIFAIVLFLNFSGSAFSQKAGKEKNPSKQEKVKWYSFEEAYNLNKKKPRKIFIDVFTDWCGWCKKMDAETFSHPVIVKYMNKEFYCVKLDAERKDTVIIDGVTFSNPNPTGRRANHQLAVELLKGRMSFPSYVFLNEKSVWMAVQPGYYQAKEFESLLHYFGDDAYQKTPWEEYRSTFEGEIK